MTKEERTLVGEIKAEIDALIRQYAMLLDTRAAIVEELKQMRKENERLKKLVELNGRCYWSGLLPFQWRS